MNIYRNGLRSRLFRKAVRKAQRRLMNPRPTGVEIRTGGTFVGADFDQVELRALAHASAPASPLHDMHQDLADRGLTPTGRIEDPHPRLMRGLHSALDHAEAVKGVISSTPQPKTGKASVRIDLENKRIVLSDDVLTPEEKLKARRQRQNEKRKAERAAKRAAKE